MSMIKYSEENQNFNLIHSNNPVYLLLEGELV